MPLSGLAGPLARVLSDFVVLELTLETVLKDSYYTQLPRGLDVLEVFTEAESVATAGKNLGYRAETFDFLTVNSRSITTPAGLQQALKLVMRLKDGGLLTLAPGRKTFGFACRS